MRLLGTRRATLIAGVATVAAVALSGCSAGQVAETALKKPSNMGVNANNSNSSVVIRNLAVVYNGTEGYKSGGTAPLELGLYNQSTEAVTVLVSSQPLEGAAEGQGVVSARAVNLVGGEPGPAVGSAAPEPAGSRPPATPDTETPDNIPDPSASNVAPSSQPSAAPSASAAAAGRPARIELEPMGSASFLPGDAQQMQVTGLTGNLVPGTSVNLIFEFSNGAEPLILQAPVGVPLSPAPRESGDIAEGHEPE